MNITTESFIDFLASIGIEAGVSGKSIKVRDCPACGATEGSVIFAINRKPNTPFLGKCLRANNCGQGFSSVSYLKMLEIPWSEISDLHGIDGIRGLERAIEPKDITEINGINDTVMTMDDLPPLDTKMYIPLEAIPNYPLAEYAFSRGYCSELSDDIMLNFEEQAIVFLVRNSKGVPVGYQWRYPKTRKVKAKTMSGMDKTYAIMQIPKAGADYILCEGPFTGVSGYRYGYSALCTMGSVSKWQLEWVKARLEAEGRRRLYVATDNDEAGEKYLRAVLSYFQWEEGWSIYSVRYANGPTKADLNDCWIDNCTPSVELEDSTGAVAKIGLDI